MRRILFGSDGAGDTVFRISKPGFDVITSTDFNDFLLNEQQYNALPYLVGSVTSLAYLGEIPSYEIDGTWYYQPYYGLTIQHNLGFLPVVLASSSTQVDVTLNDTQLILWSFSSSLSPDYNYAIFAIPVGS